ncbi:family 16 glycosylhydrolase [Nostocoides sp. F2B08]|uniref:carbohydrate binding domain-containing protein n=1 Tax=Nostocoides sp. F2B08 TaxID=2653936 RepID=UPI001263739F|nr:carbohydrate binding domain-containing protein [Tetrasphaera sp. F2B08]KAB7745655.1 family 16 glycosylhydrolase [Tetrasphaera sp. F2B08]
MHRRTRRQLSTALSAALVAGLAVIAPTSSSAVGLEVVFDDMEHGAPLANGWTSFNGAVGGGGINANNADLPPVDGGSFALETGWGSGGTPGFYGGFGRELPTDTTGTDHFSFWINPNAGQSYTLEINLQEDGAQPDGADEFQFDCVVSDAGPCAVSGGGWQLVSIPLADFVDDNSFLTGGDGVLGSQLAGVVIAVIGTGSDVNFRTDYWAFSEGPRTYAPGGVIDDFESGVAPNEPCPPSVPPLGFCTFSGAGSSVTLATTDAPPAPVPGSSDPNNVLRMDVSSTSFAGFIHGFTDPQDWSRNEGISLWMFGQNSGSQLFIDILDNRNPDSTTDDAERFTVAFVDDFSGWQLLEFPFADFVRKEIGNGAPNDGLGLFEMHGYALGALGTGGARTYYVDDVSVYGVAQPPAPAVNFARQNTFIEEGTTGQVEVRLNRPLGPDDPEQVSIDYATERSNATPGEDFTPTSGTLTFERGGPSTLSFPVETFDNTKFTGDKQIVIRLTNPVDVERGALFQGSVLIDDNDDFDPKLLDDFEQGAYLWSADDEVTLSTQDVSSDDAMARPDQDPVEAVLQVDTPVVADIEVLGNLCNKGNGVVPVHLLSTTVFDATAVDHTTVRFGKAAETHTSGRNKTPTRHVADVNRDGLKDLVFHFRARETGYDCTSTDLALTGEMQDGTPIIAGGEPVAFGRDFPIAQDWTGDAGLSFWYYGTGSGDDVTVTLKENRAPDPGPDGWELAWADEFDEPAGTPPNPANWAYELGDTTPDGKNGWGNEELQYYTDDPDNASTDGDGNLVITLDEADGSQECYYGACEFESARLITQNKAEFAYGRIESRLKVPTGGDGLWPAFWSLGTDITYNPWPGAGEIDFMEYVSREPNEIFGTIHGPGYAGGESFGGIQEFEERVDSQYRTFTVEWQPNLIVWYVDGIEYHRAVPSDVAPNPWVFEKPFFLLLNFAIGGNFGGAIDPDNAYPQEYLVDYVRVYQGPDTAERWETSFTDTVAGWQRVTVPLDDSWSRSADQPEGAPNDGLSLDEVWGYGFELPNAGTASGRVAFDLITLDPIPKPAEVTVTTLEDSGEGSLRQALTEVADGGTISFDPSLAGETLTLTSGQLEIAGSVTIDGPDSGPVTISGGDASRVVQVAAGTEVSMNDLVIRDGVAAPQGGGIRNLGELSLDRVIVTDNTQNAPGPANFEFGGGGIYNGSGATLTLTDSTVSDNTSVAQPAGGIYGFFNSTITITRSTVSGNVAGDVAGGLRSLGNSTVVNSTFSGNTSTAWHGGGIFHTDGQLTVTNSTFAGNNALEGTASGILVASFGAPASATLTNNVLQGVGGAFACAIEGGGAATITSGGSNVINDGSCNPNGTTDQSNTDALLGPLADNGGPTLTHALEAGSPAIGAADAAAAPATDQRGFARDADPDAGAFEFGASP